MFSNSPRASNFKSVPAIISGLFIWAVVNTVMVRTGLAEVPGLGLALGFVGAAAVISMGVLLSKTRLAAPLRYFGENSIVIYLAFFLFMAAARSRAAQVQCGGRSRQRGAADNCCRGGGAHPAVLGHAADEVVPAFPQACVGKTGIAACPMA